MKTKGYYKFALKVTEKVAHISGESSKNKIVKQNDNQNKFLGGILLM